MPTKPTMLGVALAVAAVSCGPPTLYDVAGRAVTQPALMAPVDGGWIAIDTSGAWVRAVLEIHVPTEPEMDMFAPLDLQLRVGDSGPVLARRVRRGRPTCFLGLPDRSGCRDPGSDPKACAWTSLQPEERCYCPVRAEFELAELPELSDLVVLRVDRQTRFILSFH